MRDRNGKLQCSWCGDRIPYRTGRPPEYCSPKCAEEDFNAGGTSVSDPNAVTRPCTNCGGENDGDGRYKLCPACRFSRRTKVAKHRAKRKQDDAAVAQGALGR